MSVLDKLATALERNDERPNVELAQATAAKGDKAAIKELVSALTTAPVAVQNDAIKVLYEIGALKPKLVAAHADAFLALLASKNNRNVWGAMQALESIAGEAPEALAKNLDAIVTAADKGSVIAKDRAVGILAKLALAGNAKAVPVLLDRVKDAAPNQFPMYAELALPAIPSKDRKTFREILEKRLAKIPQPAKRMRVEKVLKKLGA
jgi:hypothetical protein